MTPAGAGRGALPPKLYFRIGEVASLVGVEPHVLRYWEREFRSIRPSKSAKGQRVYSRRDVESLMRVRELLYAEGFTIAGAKKRLQKGAAEPHAEPEVLGDSAVRERPEQPHEEGRAAPESLARNQTRQDEIDAAALKNGLVRDQLLALRAELASFLDELGGG